MSTAKNPWNKNSLTFSTVPALSDLPAGPADPLAVPAAGVVAEVVVPRLADDVAVPAVVVVGADQPVVVLQGGVRPRDPGPPAVQRPGLRDPVQQSVVSTWIKKE